MPYNFSAYFYTGDNENGEWIILNERAMYVVADFNSTTPFTYVVGLHPNEHLDSSQLRDFTPDYVKAMPEIERKEKYWFPSPYHTHTVVFDLEKREDRILIKDKISHIVRNYYSSETPRFLNYFTRKEILDPDDATDFENAVKEFRMEFLTPPASVLFSGYDEEVEGEIILPKTQWQISSY